MNSLRSTERSISILKASAKLKQPRSSAKTFDFLIKPNGYKRAFGSISEISKPCPIIRPGRIKLETGTRVRSLSNQFTPVPLMNPNKPDPLQIKDILSKPIVPLTKPRFPKDKTENVPSVTKVLQATMPASSRFLLDKWKEAMIKKLGTAGFNKYQEETFERGRILHALLANYLLGQGDPKEISKEIVSNLWNSIQTVVKDKISNVRLVEHIVTHPNMNYRGIVDCVAFYEGELVVIDFKTAEKPKTNVASLYDNPLQVTAYCGAINCDTNIPEHIIDRNICAGLIIVAYIDGSEASVYPLKREMIVNDYWDKWVERLNQYSRMEDMKKPKVPSEAAN